MDLWKKIFNVLKENKFKVFSPSQHKGECLEKYIVVKHGSKTKYNNSDEINTILFSVLIYVPKDEYSTLNEFCNKVEETICNSLFPAIKPTGYRSEPFYDDSVKGFMVDLQLQGFLKTKNYKLNFVK